LAQSGSSDALLDHAHDDVVGNQPALVHDLLGRLAQIAARLDVRPQHVAGGDLGDGVPLLDEARLRALTGTGTAKQNDAHGTTSWS
jgi:hypothetical protein